MADRCPGRQSLRNLDSVVVPCPDCGRLVEFFTDEPKRRCRCGRVLLRFQTTWLCSGCRGEVHLTGRIPARWEVA